MATSFLNKPYLSGRGDNGMKKSVRSSTDIWEEVADKVADQGVNLEVVTLSDYVQPNRALADGDIDLNAIQHLAFLKDYVEERIMSYVI